MVCPVDSSGRFTAEVNDFEVEYVKVRERVGVREGGGREGGRDGGKDTQRQGEREWESEGFVMEERGKGMEG